MCISLEMRRDCNGKTISIELQERRGVANGDVERCTAMSLLLNTCEGMTNRVLSFFSFLLFFSLFSLCSPCFSL